MAEILGATDGEIIDSLREDLLAALQENARLEAENARLKAPVTREDQKKFCSYVDLFDPTGELCEGNWDVRNIMKMLTARSKPQEGNDAIPPTQV